MKTEYRNDKSRNTKEISAAFDLKETPKQMSRSFRGFSFISLYIKHHPSVTTIQLTELLGRMVENYPVKVQTVLSWEHLDAGIYQVVFMNAQQERISRKTDQQ